MKLREIYEALVNKGIAADPRTGSGVSKFLRQTLKDYEALPEDKRWEFDKEALTNPFADTRILCGDPDTEVKSILVGIDIEIGEVLLADALRKQGRAVDLILAHHPEGVALARLGEVMGVQADIWRDFGVSISYGDAIIGERVAEVMRNLHPHNSERTVDAAKLLNIPFMCCHTPADNNVNAYLQGKLDERGVNGTVDELIDFLKEIPEYKQAVLQGSGPVIYEGNGKLRTGKIMVDMTGGTSGPIDSISKLAAAGVGTIVGMHMGDKNRERAAKEKMNVVIAGHISSDSLGMNLILDEIANQGVEIIPCSGFTRVSRIWETVERDIGRD